MLIIALLLLSLIIIVPALVWLEWMTVPKALAAFGLQLVIASSFSACVYYSHVSDTEIWNGRVTKKEREQVSCSHSYPCNCRVETSGSGKNQTSTTVCDTCYLHSYDYDWDVRTSNGESLSIARVDMQGKDEPPRFTSVRVGEATAIEHSYVNYVKGSPDTLFRNQGAAEKYKGKIPAYPGAVYDYYRVDRLVADGVPADAAAWNAAISELNADVGAPRQANVVVVLTKKPADWFYALQEEWIGGKKNDVVLVVGVDDAMKATWVEVMAWTLDPIFKVKTRDDVLALPVITPEATTAVLHDDIVRYHKRKPMADYAYLKSAIVPTVGQWVAAILTSVVMLLVLLFAFWHQATAEASWSSSRFGGYDGRFR